MNNLIYLNEKEGSIILKYSNGIMIQSFKILKKDLIKHNNSNEAATFNFPEKFKDHNIFLSYTTYYAGSSIGYIQLSWFDNTRGILYVNEGTDSLSFYEESNYNTMYGIYIIAIGRWK